MKGLLYKEFKMFECQVKTWAAVLVFCLLCFSRPFCLPPPIFCLRQPWRKRSFDSETE